MAPSSLAQWFGAGVTFLAVVVALFKDPIREWWRKPELVATCENSPPWTAKTPAFANHPITGELLWTTLLFHGYRHRARECTATVPSFHRDAVWATGE